jgi:hypothetical protein
MSALPPKADIAESAWHVRFVPKADIEAPPPDVCFTPKSGHWLSVPRCPLCVIDYYLIGVLQVRKSLKAIA